MPCWLALLLYLPPLLRRNWPARRHKCLKFRRPGDVIRSRARAARRHGCRRPCRFRLVERRIRRSLDCGLRGATCYRRAWTRPRATRPGESCAPGISAGRPSSPRRRSAGAFTARIGGRTFSGRRCSEEAPCCCSGRQGGWASGCCSARACRGRSRGETLLPAWPRALITRPPA